ncbi:MAG TPA: 8-amino-7-oxononanoate synthase [Candidatus Acidoferrum sp.]|nr:8-amino-7-oxononanoate synthase [Candidatus Acidoferrum sp.]
MPSNVLATWTEELRNGLRALEARNLRRSLAEVHGVNLCSNDYLGLAEHPKLLEATRNAVKHAHKVGGTGSRLLSGQTEEWRTLEEEFAKFSGTEGALFFSSGYAANVGLLASLVGKDDIVYSDVLNHASLIDGMRLSGARKVIYPHLDLDALEDSLREGPGAPWRKVIITESVFSMDGDVAPLKEIAGLADKYGAAMILDEAHSMAVMGPQGRGLAAEAGIVPQLLAVIHTCGKALGCAGAFVCGPAVLREHLINHARTFIYSTAFPPYFSRQIAAALHLAAGMEKERRELQKRAERFRYALRAEGFDTAGSASQIVPVVFGKNEETLDAAGHLQQDGFAVRAIRPPTVPEGKERLRLSLTCRIPGAELERLVRSLVTWRARRPVLTTAGRA